MIARTLRFYKENSGAWFADIPEWKGDKADLQMVLGADDLLEILAQGEFEVNVHFSTHPFEGSNVMAFFLDGYVGNPNAGGGMYRMHQYVGIRYDLDLWLCDVTKFVFGDMPPLIFFNKTL